jgi:hypothetical protein
MRRASTWLVSLLVAALAACTGTDDEPVIESAAQPIFGGQLAGTCQFPSTVLLSGCTGTLVHPQIVITAAHCGTSHKTATFGETRNGPRKVPIERCQRVGNGNDAAQDYAFCKLATPVTDVPIAPPLMGCEVDQLTPGRPVVLAGFGDADDKGNGFGTKRFLNTVFNKLDRGAANVGGKGVGACYGDSGGPAFVKLNDGSWRSFGIDSEGLGESCGAGDRLAFMHTGVPWIEKTSGIDITPCHDADGTWHPGPGCGGFPLDMAATGRSWDKGCAEPALSPPAATCGAAYAAGASDAAIDSGTGDDGGGSGGAEGRSDAGRSDARSGGATGTGSGGAAGMGGGGPSGGAAGTGSGGSPAAGSGGARAGSGETGGSPGAPAASNNAHSAGGCSMGGPARAEGGMALLAAIAFAVAFILRRRWFPRGPVVEAPTKTHAGRHVD